MVRNVFKFATPCYGASVILSAYERKDSPFVHIQYGDANEVKRYKKTRIRKDDPDKALKVAKALNELEAQLLKGPQKARIGSWAWVSDYLRQRYAANKRTLQIYLIHWNWLRAFFERSEIDGPGQFQRAHAFQYLDWRTSQVKQKSGRSPGINTAIDDLKVLGLILDEAARRNMIEKNEARRLDIKRTEPALKPEIFDQEIETIYPALKEKWMFRSFHIGLHTALRFSDTAIERNRVNWREQEIVIELPKGGRKRAFAIKIYPSIRPMIEEFMDSQEPVLWTLPPKERALVGLTWMHFFRGLGLRHLCFHCTRVSFITRGARAGVPEGMMMLMVNHASKEIHRIYQRLAATDALRYRSQIAIPTYRQPTD